MKFTLRSPCKECPFLRTQGFLSQERAEQIAFATLVDEQTFTCHKQITGVEVKDRYKPGVNDLHCAGALIMSEKNGRPNRMHQIAQRLGLYDPSKLDMTADVYVSVEDMRLGHGKR